MTQVNAMLGVAEVSRRLGLSPDAVRKACKRRTLAATFEDGAFRIPESEVERYQREHRRPGHRVIRP